MPYICLIIQPHRHATAECHCVKGHGHCAVLSGAVCARCGVLVCTVCLQALNVMSSPTTDAAPSARAEATPAPQTDNSMTPINTTETRTIDNPQPPQLCNNNEALDAVATDEAPMPPMTTGPCTEAAQAHSTKEEGSAPVTRLDLATSTASLQQATEVYTTKTYASVLLSGIELGTTAQSEDLSATLLMQHGDNDSTSLVTGSMDGETYVSGEALSVGSLAGTEELCSAGGVYMGEHVGLGSAGESVCDKTEIESCGHSVVEGWGSEEELMCEGTQEDDMECVADKVRHTLMLATHAHTHNGARTQFVCVA